MIGGCFDDVSLGVTDGFSVFVHVDFFHFCGVAVEIFAFDFDVGHGVARGCGLFCAAVALFLGFAHGWGGMKGMRGCSRGVVVEFGKFCAFEDQRCVWQKCVYFDFLS